jgi:hypothetical protein
MTIPITRHVKVRGLANPFDPVWTTYFARRRTAKRAATTISGIELMHRIGKDQFDLRDLRFKDTTAPSVWNAVLSN